MLIPRSFSAILILATISICTSAQSALSAPLRYHPQKDQEFAYEYKIIADIPRTILTHKLVNIYKVKYTNNAIGLTISNAGSDLHTDQKPDRLNRQVPYFPTQFRLNSNHYRGLHFLMPNEIEINDRGEVVIMKGNSHLPYLLGNMSTLIFETLPESPKDSWTNNDSRTIYERDKQLLKNGKEPDRFLHDEIKITGSVTSTLTKESEEGDLLKFKKTYKLETPKGQDQVAVEGEGTWVFNQKLGMPESMDFKYKIFIYSSNTTVTVPVSLQYKRFSEEEYAAYKKKKQEQREETQRKFEELAAKKRAPLTESERAGFVADLESNNEARQKSALRKLRYKEETPPDPQIAAAIKPLLNHPDHWISRDAQKAMVNFSPEFKQKHDLEEAYHGPMPLKNVYLGPGFKNNITLPVGLIVAVEEHNRWQPAMILEEIGNGEYRVELQRSHFKETIHWTNIRLAPPKLDQPRVAKKVLAKLYDDQTLQEDATASEKLASESNDKDAADSQTSDESLKDFRTWTDNTGTFKIEAKYIDVAGTSVRLERKKDGKELRVPLNRLSNKDREIIKRIQAMPKVTNPFE